MKAKINTFDIALNEVIEIYNALKIERANNSESVYKSEMYEIVTKVCNKHNIDTHSIIYSLGIA